MQSPKPLATKEQLTKAAHQLLQEKVLSKGGAQPSQDVVEVAARYLALKALKEQQAQKTAD